jgi:hypothetical protein
MEDKMYLNGVFSDDISLCFAKTGEISGTSEFKDETRYQYWTRKPAGNAHFNVGPPRTLTKYSSL